MAAVHRPKDPLIHLAAGGVSGLTSCLLLQPLDLRLQQSMQARHSLVSTLSEAQARLLSRITIYSTLQDVVKQDGVRGLWRGTLPTIMRNVPGSALYFLAVHKIRSAFRKIDLSTHTSNLIAGASSRMVVGFVAMPITVVKIRFESNLYKYSSIWHSMSSIWKMEGASGFFKGFGATALRDAPYAGVYIFFYEGFKSMVGGDSSPSVAANMVAGVLGGLSATIVTQPFDMVKTRMQLKPAEYTSLVQSFFKIAVAEGISGFFIGTIPRLLRKSFGSAITWSLYEEVVRCLSNESFHS
ncbi:hypothetical protein BASA50_002980 [Batrachochytrium salamandrivorans]|uniref:Mitochondrial glycine transporter n=1 Tax=Batrachochytrium salamandrivorans TaxID=1357716 RepID=A0ABQ8FJN7_9FUNG|nr:hypothetical protein BASA62_004541 [Batrachochytrium salamandrivorans]KAH6571568.1 hypothetical protein BASA60_007092 [Batrachochytrium salamandrivorans]KAH6599466.1 hypothetical protein BASA50_002980 [Batrachochytrium salamandrivorans]KAH9267562.1 hypothetical protein BASA84_000614 [Batrachochytrium salamandrivorans]